MYKRTSPLKQFAAPVEDKQAITTVPGQPNTGMAGNPSMQTTQAQTGYPPMDNAIPKVSPTPLMQRGKIFKK